MVNVDYEWKPVICDHCKLLGHIAKDYKKKKGKKVWVIKLATQDVGGQEKIDT